MVYQEQKIKEKSRKEEKNEEKNLKRINKFELINE